MELVITKFFNEATPSYYSASRMELGDDAGAITWANAMDASEDYNLLDTEEKREAARAHFASFGAWTEEEIAAWSDAELNAITLQDISAAIRDFVGDKWDWAEYEKQSEAGQVSGALFQGISGEIYFTLGG